MNRPDHDTFIVSIEEAHRNLGLTAHYSGIVADCLAAGNVEIALQAFQSLVLHVRLAGVDVRAIGEAASRNGRAAA